MTLLSIGLLENAVKMQINGPQPPSLLKYNLLGGFLAMSFVTSSSGRQFVQVACVDTLRTTALIHDSSLYSYCIPGLMGKP